MKPSSRFGPLLLQTLLLIAITYRSFAVAEKKTYIVHMDRSTMPTSFTDHFEWYDSALKTVSDSGNMLYAYTDVIHGFSARLTADEAKSLESHPGVLSLLEEVKYELHTTRTPQFLGLDASQSLFPDSTTASDVVVGVLDTGVWPESKSFDDTGLGPVPSSWKGECEAGNNFNTSHCNRKLIGARFFSKGYEGAFGPIVAKTESKSPRDDDGHGTHTSTTAAGSAVAEASLFGYAAGTARGMARHARVAAYKICWQGGCFSSDIVAAMDAAVKDGVNVLSMSIGGSVTDYDRDSVAIGAFGAMTKGILVSCSAGNGGPGSMTLSNIAPWITTVGAGTLDREFPAYAMLGSGKNYSGVSLYSGKPLSDSSLVPLVYAANVSNSSYGNLCMTGSLIPAKVSGKIVVCDRGLNSRVQKGVVVKDAGGIGMILTNTESYGEELVADTHLIPTVAVGQLTGDAIKKYILSDTKPTATITFAGTQLGVQPSPVVAAFSSRGPNPITPDILKPDLIAPGVNILAGWTGAAGPTGLQEDTRRVSFNIVSGTSMSCPHVSGLAALVKGVHFDWSPAAVKSALMTTTYTTYKDGETIKDIATGRPSTPFDYGAGHVNPVAALDPGLVYDAGVDDYLGFLCALNYTSARIKTISQQDYTCESGKKYSLGDLNYPSFVVPLQTASGQGGGSSAATEVKYTRTLTNVGTPATYKASVSSKTRAVKITVEPESLTFSQTNEKKTFTVSFSASSMPSGTNEFARMEWSDGKHTVGSPIAISWT